MRKKCGWKQNILKKENNVMKEARTKRDLLETMEKLNKQKQENMEQKERSFDIS